MDKKITQNIKSGVGSFMLNAGTDEPFNGWFLMKTPQVSTGGVSYFYSESDWKMCRSCNKIAVGFFSLHAGYPVLKIDLTPSKYKFMKNAFFSVLMGSPCFTATKKDRANGSLLTVKTITYFTL
jgi:hypothetical protein